MDARAEYHRLFEREKARLESETAAEAARRAELLSASIQALDGAAAAFSSLTEAAFKGGFTAARALLSGFAPARPGLRVTVRRDTPVVEQRVLVPLARRGEVVHSVEGGAVLSASLPVPIEGADGVLRVPTGVALRCQLGPVEASERTPRPEEALPHLLAACWGRACLVRGSLDTLGRKARAARSRVLQGEDGDDPVAAALREERDSHDRMMADSRLLDAWADKAARALEDAGFRVHVECARDPLARTLSLAHRGPVHLSLERRGSEALAVLRSGRCEARADGHGLARAALEVAARAAVSAVPVQSAWASVP